jgi:hypothetical protein
LSFLLNYKAARVRVVVDCGYNNWTITGIANTMQLSSVALAQSINLMSGDPSGDSAGNKTVTWSISGESTEQISNPLIVMPTATSTTLTVTLPVNVVTRKSPLYPIPTEAGYTGKFTTTLQAGHSYKLFVKLKAPKFAGSNIYYNGSTLIFDPHGSNDNQGYQGVYFKFGSLMGISGVGDFTANTTLVYKPTGGSKTYGSWAAIEYTSSGDIGEDNSSGGTGDICRYLSQGSYRLPVSGEWGVDHSTAFYSSPPVAGGWVKITGSASTAVGSAEGKTDLIKTKQVSYAFNQTMNVALPMAGHRTTAVLAGVGGNGNGGTGTGESSNNQCRYITFYSNTIITNGTVARDFALPIRCVKAD